MPPTLQALNGPAARQKYEIMGALTRLGRHPDCEVPVDINSVSRYHAQITREGQAYFIEDLQSRNGTFVNARKIEQRTELRHGDRIKICEVLFLFSNAEQEPSTQTEATGALVDATPEETPSTVVTSLEAEGTAESLITVNTEAKLRAMLEITQAVASTLRLDDLFPKLLESLFKIFPQADRGLIILADAAGHLIPRAAKHRRPGDDTIRFSKTIVRQAMSDRRAILSADASNDARFSLAQSIADFRIRSVMCVPLLAQNKTALGVLQIDTQSIHQRFGADDLQLLLNVGIQAAQAIENAKLHESILQQERIDRELKFAKEIQMGFLPKEMPAIHGLAFWAFYQAAGQVGGDYYDFVKLPAGKLAVLVGDVSGKGIPAALFMAKVTSDAKVALLTYPDRPAEAMGLINDAVCAAGLIDKFITVAMCVIDPQEESMCIVNGGHMSPIVRRANGTLDEPAGRDVTGLPIGVIEHYPFNSTTTALNAGDSVILYTDGINEALNAREELYGGDRLREIIRDHDLPPDQLGALIVADVRRHVAGCKQSDDMTLVVFHRVA